LVECCGGRCDFAVALVQQGCGKPLRFEPVTIFNALFLMPALGVRLS
jgi:hypothetical protein